MNSTKVFKLVPSGRKLADLAASLQLFGLLFSVVLTNLCVKFPELKNELRADLLELKSSSSLTPEIKRTLEEAIRFIDSIAVGQRKL
jgi:hypothetical protein